MRDFNLMPHNSRHSVLTRRRKWWALQLLCGNLLKFDEIPRKHIDFVRCTSLSRAKILHMDLRQYRKSNERPPEYIRYEYVQISAFLKSKMTTTISLFLLYGRPICSQRTWSATLDCPNYRRFFPMVGRYSQNLMTGKLTKFLKIENNPFKHFSLSVSLPCFTDTVSWPYLCSLITS